MKYNCTVISVADINAARKFYEDLFGLEVVQYYGRNIAFTLSLIHICRVPHTIDDLSIHFDGIP